MSAEQAPVPLRTAHALCCSPPCPPRPAPRARLRLIHWPPLGHAEHKGRLVGRGRAGGNAVACVPAPVDALRRWVGGRAGGSTVSRGRSPAAGSRRRLLEAHVWRQSQRLCYPPISLPPPPTPPRDARLRLVGHGAPRDGEHKGRLLRGGRGGGDAVARIPALVDALRRRSGRGWAWVGGCGGVGGFGQFCSWALPAPPNHCKQPPPTPHPHAPRWGTGSPAPRTGPQNRRCGS